MQNASPEIIGPGIILVSKSAGDTSGAFTFLPKGAFERCGVDPAFSGHGVISVGKIAGSTFTAHPSLPKGAFDLCGVGFDPALTTFDTS